MAKRIQIGGDDFGELVRDDLLFVDKSLFIKEVINDKSKVTIITRPRRWGKTLNLSMLHYFLSAEVHGQKTKRLFDNLLIAKEPEDYITHHQGKYPVIFLTLKDVKMSTFGQALEKLRSLIQAVYQEHKILTQKPLDPEEQALFQRHLNKQTNEVELGEALLYLSKLLYQHYQQKVYILIDEYDTPLNFARDQEYFDDMVILMKNFLSNSLKGNPFLQKGVVTGILRISKDSMLSGLNNPEIYTVLQDKLYAPYFGFTDSELDPLFADQNLVKNEADVKAWYNGYCINGLTLYNPWSIMCCLKNKADLIPYWLNTGDDSLLKQLLQQASNAVKDQFRSLVLDESVVVSVNPTMRFDQLKTNKSMLWNLLISAGYLKVLSSTMTEAGFYRCQLAIPNREVRGLYHSIFLEWLIEFNEPEEFKDLFNLLCLGKTTEFAKTIENFLKMAASIHDYSSDPEAFHHGFMLALCVSLTSRYYIFSNRESGEGRPDLVIIPKDTTQSQAVILEFKTVKDKQTLQQRAEEGLKQIQAREYASMINQFTHIKTTLSVGMAFDGKNVLCLPDKN